MKKILALVLVLQSTIILADTYTFEGNDYQCKESNTGKLAVKIGKGDENIFHIGVKLNDACEIQERDFFRLYWLADRGSRSHCMGLTSIEKKFFKFNYNQIQKSGPKSLRWNTNIAKKIIKKARKNGYVVNPWIDIKVEKDGETCVTKSCLTVNGELVELDEMQMKLNWLFQVTTVSTYLKDVYLNTFFK